ncbi:MAG: NIL domain-containing protein [Chthonomonas sp.]|nr:NIL domain-containing protein [Chthonomonas sp.]
MALVDIHLTAKGDAVNEPFIWRIGRDFDVKVNIVKASIDTDFGWMHITLEGAVEEIQRATSWLMTTGLHVDTQQRSVKA